MKKNDIILLNDEMVNKKIGDLTVKEFMDLFPEMTKRKIYYTARATEVRSKILSMLDDKTVCSIWDLSKKLGIPYDTVRYNANLMIQKEIIRGTKTVNSDGRPIIILRRNV